MTVEDILLDLAERCVYASLLKKLVFSKAKGGAYDKVEGTLRRVRQKTVLFLASYRADKVFHRTVEMEEVGAALAPLVADFDRINLITEGASASFSRSKKGSATLLGKEKIEVLLKSGKDFSDTLTESLNESKQYILSGEEPFLRLLGISDKSGRVHDKKQAKFRQINRFLEHIRDIEDSLPKEGPLLIYDLCCGKSYLSFAVYHYFAILKGRSVEMLGMDLKKDCMEFCADAAKALGFSGMRFETGDIRRIPKDRTPDLVLSLHACDIATDIVLQFATEVGARVILSTPCCHRNLTDKIRGDLLPFLTKSPRLKGKLAEVLTDALRLSRLEAFGYKTVACELTDPDDTPKNTLLRAIKSPTYRPDSQKAREKREAYLFALRSVLGESAEDYPFENTKGENT
ncbi:MAG: SAM-dependent methyltransferase [Clostridia bacterium]|nr:SAM-dependent methyltransferase [Clostridia bacterium]